MVMYEKDFIMRQIKGITQAMAKLIFRREDAIEIQYELEDEEAKKLYKELDELLKAGKLKEMNEMFLNEYRKDHLDYLKIAIHLYDFMNDMEEDELEKGGITRDSLYHDLMEVSSQFGFML